MENVVKSLAEVGADNLHCSPLTDVSCPAITEVYQIGEAWFLLSESTLKEITAISQWDVHGKKYLADNLP